MIVKPLCEYDIHILRYIEDTLVMLNGIYGVNYISRDGDGELAVHSTYPKLSRYTGMYARDTEVNHSKQASLLDGIERSFDFNFPVEWKESEPRCGVLKIERLIYDIRKAIDEKKNSSDFVYKRLKELKDKRLRVMYALVSEYDKMDYKYITRYKKDSYIVSVWSKFPYKRGDFWTSDTFSLDIEDISGLLPRTDWPVKWEDDRPVHVSEILQAITKLDVERNGSIFGNDVCQQAVNKTFSLEADIQAAIDKYRRELEVINNG